MMTLETDFAIKALEIVTVTPLYSMVSVRPVDMVNKICGNAPASLQVTRLGRAPNSGINVRQIARKLQEGFRTETTTLKMFDGNDDDDDDDDNHDHDNDSYYYYSSNNTSL
ncbi:hypothetical protein ACROYT_G028396 [Oculina patagonica]